MARTGRRDGCDEQAGRLGLAGMIARKGQPGQEIWTSQDPILKEGRHLHSTWPGGRSPQLMTVGVTTEIVTQETYSLMSPPEWHVPRRCNTSNSTRLAQDCRHHHTQHDQQVMLGGSGGGGAVGGEQGREGERQWEGYRRGRGRGSGRGTWQSGREGESTEKGIVSGNGTKGCDVSEEKAK